jgi:uncharacterized protein
LRFSMQCAVVARALPFFAFVAALALRSAAQNWTSLDSRWLYLLQPASAVLLLALYWPLYREIHRPALSRRAIAMSVSAGLLMFVVWIHATEGWMQIDSGATRFAAADADGALRWDLIAFRLTSAVIVVPIVEELFWRSFLMRWIDRREFLELDPRRASPRALALSSAVFALAHPLWLAGLLAGLLYGWIYRRSANLWYAIAAHAATNLALGIWVIRQRAWSFW